MSENFVTLTWRNIRDKRTTPQEKFILAEISQLSILELGCVAKNEHFADLLGVEKESVSRSINSLKKKGFINVKIKNGSRNNNRKITLNKLLTYPKQIVNRPLTNCSETKENKSINKSINNIDIVFDYWKKILNHPKSKLDSARKTKIKTALKSFAVDELKQAIDGNAKSPYHNGTKYDTVHDSIDLIFRNNDKIETFIKLSKSKSSEKKWLTDSEVNDMARINESWDELFSRLDSEGYAFNRNRG